nr:integrase, catalytic region, zinc finger, CCHC-type, peptidase aspartic, catalytic [Tanacetum cinerariifolium]
MLLMQAQENGVALDAKQLLFLAGGQDNVFDDDVDEQLVQDLALNVDNLFQANDCDAFDSDVDEAPTAQTMFMANLSSADHVADEAEPSYDSDILSEVPDYEHYMDAACAHHEGHYVRDNEVPVVHSGASSVPTDAFMMIYNNMCESPDPSISHTSRNTVVKNSLTTELATYEEHVELKRDAIKLKNLLITNDNLIVACLSQEVFSVATNSKLNIARFIEMHVANTTVKARCLALEAELANLRNNNHDNQKELINHFSKLEVNHLNLQLKYQNLKDSMGNNPPIPDKDTLDFDSIFVIGKMQASLQGKDNVINQLKKQLSQLQETHSDTDRTPKVQTTYSQTTKLTSHVTHLQAQNDLFRAENNKIKQHYKDLYDSIKITHAKHIEQHAIDVGPIVPRLRKNRDAHLDYLRHLKESVETIHDIVEEAKIAHIPLIKKKQVTGATPFDKSDRTTHKHVVTVKTQKTNVPVPPSTGVNRCPKASGSQPKSNPKPNRISPAKGVDKLPVEDQPMAKMSHVRTTNHVDSSSRLKRT